MEKENFEKFVEELQQEIIEKELQDFNETIVELFHHPQNWGFLPEHEIDVSQSNKGECGDSVTFFLNIQNGIIKKATFITDGCGATVAAASQTTILIKNKSLEFAVSLTPEDINKALNGLPESHKHCAELSIRTLRQTLFKYKNKKSKRE